MNADQARATGLGCARGSVLAVPAGAAIWLLIAAAVRAIFGGSPW